MTESNVVKSVLTILNELIQGSAAGAAWVLNPGDPGLVQSIEKLSAEQASAPPATGGASIAAHVDHLRYGLSLLNRWGRGEKDPFSDANFGASWKRTTVSDADWKSLQEALRSELHAWRDALQVSRELSEFESTGVVASAVHLAYHMGAIRQINRSTSGPSARD